VPDIYSGM